MKNAMIAVVKTPGAASGTMTLRNACQDVAPSTCAACSISQGISRKNADSVQIEIGSVSDRYGMMSPGQVSYRPICRHRLNSGVTIEMTGKIATPSAVAAGALASAAVLTDLPPLVKWSVAILAGGGAAGLVQTATVLTRVGSTTFTGGLGNVLFATFELFGAVGTVVLAIALPFVAFALLLLLLVAAAVVVTRVARRGNAEHAA